MYSYSIMGGRCIVIILYSVVVKEDLLLTSDASSELNDDGEFSPNRCCEIAELIAFSTTLEIRMVHLGVFTLESVHT